MSNKNKKNQKNKSNTTTPVVDTKDEKKKHAKEIPTWLHANGKPVKKLKSSDFPYTKAGKLAYADYRIACWQEKKIEIAKQAEPKNKLQTQREKLQKKLADVEAKIEAEQNKNS